jgi:RNA polymerase sigma-70 factor, ECF subfamily
MTTDVLRQIETHIPRLRRYARLLAQDPNLADDMVQDCLERACSHAHLYRTDLNLRGWLCTILLNVVRSHARKARHRQWAPMEEHMDRLPCGPRQYDALQIRDLRRAYAKLAEMFQEIIILIVIEGMTYEEAARVLEVPVGTVRSRLSRARGQLKALIDGAEPLVPPAPEALAIRTCLRGPARPRHRAAEPGAG